MANEKPSMPPMTQPSLVRAWDALKRNRPELARREVSVESGRVIIAQGQAFPNAILIVEGHVRGEVFVEHDGLSERRTFFRVGPGYYVFTEELFSQYISRPARYSVIAEIPTTFILLDTAWLEELELLRGHGHFEFSFVECQAHMWQHMLDEIEEVVREKLELKARFAPQLALRRLLEATDRRSKPPDTSESEPPPDSC